MAPQLNKTFTMYSPLVLLLTAVCAAEAVHPRPASSNITHGRKAQPAVDRLTDFQVYEPILTPEGPSDQYGCVYTTTLMKHDFANSYGQPFVGNYAPPPCSFNRVTMNLTVTSRGRQFDRIAIMYLGDVEVFRTSTAEPTKDGIVWSYVKEMHMYNALWRTPQTVIFDEGNIVDGTYTGVFHTTLTATFFTVPDSSATADMILPITTRQGAGGKGSVFQLPDQNASVAYRLPRNVNRAVVSLSATGQIGEEFWYSNAPSSRVDTFASTTGSLPGGGTFREVQLYIDGHLSGVSWPFPVIFTGGIVPGLWRPIVGIDAFDLRQHEIDITPWLGYLLDGKFHTFAINVASVNDDGKGHATLTSVPSYWLVTGTIFLFQDPAGSITKGTFPTINAPAVSLVTTSSVTQDSTGQNDTLTYSTQASREISISSYISTANDTFLATWSQQLTYSNTNHLTSRGIVQFTEQTTSGHDLATRSRSGTTRFSTSQSYSYPLTVNSSFISSGDGSSLTIDATLDHGKSIKTLGDSIFSTGGHNLNNNNNESSIIQHQKQSPILSHPQLQGTHLTTTQTGSASYFASPGLSYSFGTTGQEFRVTGVPTRSGAGVGLYSRCVRAVNASLVRDDGCLGGEVARMAQQDVLMVEGDDSGGRLFKRWVGS